MRTSSASILLTFIAAWLTSGACAATVPAQAHVPTLPFTLTWTQGKCRNCKIADRIVDVQFVTTNEAWAVGYAPPGGDAGAGDYATLHSRDGGKSWSEISEPWQHNEGPSISFANANEGWLRDVDVVAAETRLMETRDGGGHWRRLAMRDLGVKAVQYLGGGVGYGTGYDVYSKAGYLIATSDHGRHWNRSPFPQGFSPGLMHFTGRQDGVVAGCLDRQPTVIRTTDRGIHWAETTLILASSTSKVFAFCDIEPDSLDFLDAQHGWLLTSKHAFGLHDEMGEATAFATNDGGKTWKPIYRATFRAGQEQFYSLNFLNTHLGFLTQFGTRKGQPVGVLQYTTDGGHQWERIDLPHWVSRCKRFGDALECAAGEDGFWILRISPSGLTRN
jgi:photosystem II stability/assembly factor-like uncharacterized protein